MSADNMYREEPATQLFSEKNTDSEVLELVADSAPSGVC